MTQRLCVDVNHDGPVPVEDWRQYHIDGEALLMIYAVALRLYSERRLNGDEMRDMAQKLDAAIQHASLASQ